MRAQTVCRRVVEGPKDVLESVGCRDGGEWRGVELPWNVLDYLCNHFFSSCADAAGVVGHPSKASFPFTTSTFLSAPPVASSIIAVRLGSHLPEFLQLPPGANSTS